MLCFSWQLASSGEPVPSDRRSKQQVSAIAPRDHLEALLYDYELARGDERQWLPLVATTVAFLVTAIGTLPLGLKQGFFQCALDSGVKCPLKTQVVLSALPVVPLAALAILALAGTMAVVRTFYMRYLEKQIRDLLELEMKVDASLDEPPFAFCWAELASEVNITRRGQLLYRSIVSCLFFGLVSIYAGVAIFIGFHVGPWIQAFMAVVYSGASILLLGSAVKSGVAGHSLMEESVRALREHMGDPDLQLADTNRPKRSLLRYFVFPHRFSLFAARFLFVIGTAALLVVFEDHASHYSTWRTTLIVVSSALFFELGVYSARDQLEDLQFWHDKQHDSVGQTDVPTSPSAHVNSSNAWGVLVILVCRLVVPFLLVTIAAESQLRWAGIIVGVVLFFTILQSVPAGYFISGAARFLVSAGHGLAAWRIAEFLGARPSTWAWLLIVATAVVCGGRASEKRLQRISKRWTPRARGTLRAFATLLFGQAAEALFPRLFISPASE